MTSNNECVTDLARELKDATHSAQMVTCEQMSSAASHLRRNWGEEGYRLGVVQTGSRALFGARHSDGSEFFFFVDRYGNVTDIPEGGAA